MHRSIGIALDNSLAYFSNPKRVKCAITFGYRGDAYRGSAFNCGETRDNTVEEYLIRALGAAGGIVDIDMHALHWSRSSRTDKGVHALANTVGTHLLVSSKSIFSLPHSGSEIADVINKYLPEDISVFAVQEMSQGFNARKCCMQRSYRYIFPLSVLRADGANNCSDSNLLDKFRCFIRRFRGKHSFHNYTQNSYKNDFAWLKNPPTVVPEHFRLITHIDCTDPFLYSGSNIPVVEVQITGNSFLTHQIRCIMAAGILATRAGYPQEFISASLAMPARLQIPKAPPETLVLAGNEFYVRSNAKKLVLDLDSRMKINLFRSRFIDPSLCKAIATNEIWDGFVQSLDMTIDANKNHIETFIDTYCGYQVARM